MLSISTCPERYRSPSSQPWPGCLPVPGMPGQSDYARATTVSQTGVTLSSSTYPWCSDSVVARRYMVPRYMAPLSTVHHFPTDCQQVLYTPLTPTNLHDCLVSSELAGLSDTGLRMPRKTASLTSHWDRSTLDRFTNNATLTRATFLQAAHDPASQRALNSECPRRTTTCNSGQITHPYPGAKSRSQPQTCHTNSLPLPHHNKHKRAPLSDNIIPEPRRQLDHHPAIEQ